MKKKSNSKKFSLNKITVSKLNTNSLGKLVGGHLETQSLVWVLCLTNPLMCNTAWVGGCDNNGTCDFNSCNPKE